MLVKITTPFSGGSRTIKVVGQSADKVVAHEYFQRWLKAFDHERMIIESIFIQSADIFANGKVIFVKFEALIKDAVTGKDLPGIVFMRGDSIAIFVLVESEDTGETYILLIRQPRIPMGDYEFVECPAGMLDKGDGLVSRGLAELKEETSVEITQEQLVALGSYAPSTGGCDESVHCFATKIRLPQAKIDEICLRTHGCENENEQINVFLLSIEEFVSQLVSNQIKDSKVLVAMLFMLLKTNPNILTETLKHWRQ